MAFKGIEFYDQDEIFANYMARRNRPESPNETLEKPVIVELLGDVAGKHILDLGCGDGRFGAELLKQGCASYTGVEVSRNMIALAEQALAGQEGRIEPSAIENWAGGPQAYFDLVISRLALHYIEDLGQVLQRVYSTLISGGRFIFSVLHPVLTSCSKSAAESSRRTDWIVDDYFIEGFRSVPWMGSEVSQYHRTAADYFQLLQAQGFIIEHLSEARPKEEHFSNKDLLSRRLRIPLFLILSSHKF